MHMPCARKSWVNWQATFSAVGITLPNLRSYYIVFIYKQVGSACVNQPQTSMDFRFDI